MISWNKALNLKIYGSSWNMARRVRVEVLIS